MAAWIQGADIVYIGTTVHQMVFTLITDATIAKGADLKGKKIGVTRKEAYRAVLGGSSQVAFSQVQMPDGTISTA